MRSGFQQRLTHFAAALQGFLRGKVTLDQLEERLNYVACHQESAQQAERMERVRMALRLARYLPTQPDQETPSTLAHAAGLYAEHGGYVDWARRYLLSGDEIADLAAAFGLLAAPCPSEREQQNKQFAVLLAAWHRAPGAAQRVCCPSNRPCRRLVARLARATSVLLLVMDALSYADCCELLQDLSNRGWMTLTDQPGSSLAVPGEHRAKCHGDWRAPACSPASSHAAIALWKSKTLPRMPSYSPCRAPPIRRCCSTKVSCWKRALLACRQRCDEALRNVHQSVVGVVVNAVDDHLAKSDQLRLSWTIEQFHHLDALTL